MIRFVAAALVAIALAGCAHTRDASDAGEPAFPTVEKWWE